MSGPPVTTVVSDFTRRLSCRDGDLLLWMRPGNVLIGTVENLKWEMPDCWFLQDGTNILITNRSIDLPDWIELHPMETAGALAFQTMRRLQTGWLPSDPVDAPNIWRVCAGDRVAFAGKSRPGVSACADGLVEIFDFRESAMIVGEAYHGGLEDFMSFGQPGDSAPSKQQQATAEAAVEAIRRLGMPRSLALKWHLER